MIWKLRNVAVAALIVGLSLVVWIVGVGTASAQVDQGRYRVQAFGYGVIPGDKLPARVIGDELIIYQHRGPATHLKIKQRRNGAVLIGYPGDPAGQFGSRTELYRIKAGYRGAQYVYGVPMNDLVLWRVR